MTSTRSAFVFSLTLLSPYIYAGDTPRNLQAVRSVTPPVIDGYLDDAVWRQASPAADFTQRDPEEGKPASERTAMSVLYDDEALYIGCMFFDSEPEKIVARLTRRDNVIESDRASIYIDSYHDHQTAYEFSFNAAGVKVDILHYDDGNKSDISWDEVWYLETRILQNGWSAELKIPFRILRYRSPDDNTGEDEWGMNITRYISRKQETARWAFTPKRESGFVSRFGHLTGLRDLPHPGQFEVAPFVVGRQRYEPSRPFQNRLVKSSADAGMDVKYSLSRSFTLDATVNPDFGQVEADPAVLNLTTFETFYPERRPFFVEGTQILRFTTFGGDLGPGMFYSRRIGRGISPFEVHVGPGERIEDLPQSTTILGAAKVNGKTAGGLSVGILQAVTEEEEAVIRDANNMHRSQILEPLAQYNIIRLKQDIFTNSNIGTIVTSVARRNRYPAIVNGYDWYINLDRNTYLFEGFFAHTHVDQSRERIHGSAGRFNFSRVAAEHWLWGIGGRYASRRYDINDLGFFFRPDGYTGLAQLIYKEDRPGPIVRNSSISLGLTEFHNMSDVSLQRETRLSGDVLFVNYWRINASASLDAGEYDDRETRGTGLYDRPQTYTTGATIYSDARENVSGRIGLRFGWDSKHKWQYATDIGVTVRPLSWMEWQAESQYEIVRTQEAWVTNTPYPEGMASIFGDRDTDQLNFTLRGNITFTRDLTLQLYTQLFLAKGHYENFRRLVGTSSFEPAVSSSSDFNRQSFNSNIVLRWEYLPGSTMFLVWSQARRGEETEYFTSVRDDFDQIFHIAPANVVLLKVSYRLSL